MWNVMGFFFILEDFKTSAVGKSGNKNNTSPPPLPHNNAIVYYVWSVMINRYIPIIIWCIIRVKQVMS